jgi:ELWxxDGT repeat protein
MSSTATPSIHRNRPDRLAAAGLSIALGLLIPTAPVAASDPSAYQVKDINDGGSSNVEHLTNVGGILYFSAAGSGGRELWKSDGTEDGTVRVKNIRPGPDGSDPHRLTNVGGTLFFAADDGTSGRELWKSDGTALGTTRVKDIRAGGASSDPRSLLSFGGIVYFGAHDGTHGRELWKSDGTAAGTRLVKDLRPGRLGSFPDELVRAGDRFVFVSIRLGGALWRSDGTAAGTKVIPTDSGAGPLSAYGLTRAGALVFLGGSSCTHDFCGDALWRTDGTPAGTMRLRNLPQNCGGSDCDYDLDFTAIGSTLYFKTSNHRLWKSDGTVAGTVKVTALFGCDPELGCARSFTNVAGRLFFIAPRSEFSEEQQEYVPVSVELWKSNGTASGTRLVKTFVPPYGASASTAAIGGVYYFVGHDDASGIELWRSDGTEAGTSLVHDIDTGFGSAHPSGLTTADGTLYFAADDGIHGGELWRYVP